MADLPQSGPTLDRLVRITIGGDLAVSTESAGTVSPDGDPHWNNVHILVNGGVVKDESSFQHSYTLLNNSSGMSPTVITDDPDFPYGCIEFGNGNGNIQFNASDLYSGADDWTFEFDYKTIGKLSPFPCVACYGTGILNQYLANDAAYLDNHNLIPGNCACEFAGVFPVFETTAGFEICRNIAMVCSSVGGSRTLTLYIDGEFIGSTTTNALFSTGLQFALANDSLGLPQGAAFVRLARVRLTLGVARYSAPFIWDRRPYPTHG